MSAVRVRATVLGGLIAAAALAGCGSGGASSGATGPAVAATSSAQVPGGGDVSAADVLFTQMMIPHHQQALTMAELAADRAKDPEVARLAEQIVAAQKPELDAMVGWMQALGKPTTAPGSEMDHGPGEHAVPGMLTFGELTRLSAASGRKFDRQFLTAMIAHHRGAISAAKEQVAKGRNPVVKSLAEEIVTGQRAEIAAIRKILARL